MRQDRLLGEPAHAGEISFQDSMHRLQGMPDDGGDLLHRATRFGEACNRRATEVVENPSHSIKQSDGGCLRLKPSLQPLVERWFSDTKSSFTVG